MSSSLPIPAPSLPPAVVTDFDVERIAAGVPYAPVPAAGDEAWRGLDAPSVAAILDDAVVSSSRPIPQLTRRQWLDFSTKGDRTSFERPYFERRRRLTLFALASALHPSDAHASALREEISAVLAEESWCVPAHNRQPGGEVDALPDPARPVVDLFAAETAGLLAWTLAVHGGRLGVLAERTRSEIERRVLVPFERTAHLSFWFGAASNWNPWIVSNVVTAVLLATPSDAPVSRTVARLRLVVDSLGSYAARVPQDGGCAEGIMYWWQSGARFFEAVEMLGLGDAGTFARVLSSSPVRRMAAYPLVVGLGDGVWNAAFADGRARALARSGGSMNERYAPELLHRFARAVGDVESAEYARVMRGAEAPVVLPLPLGRAVKALFDEEWCALDPTVGPAAASSPRWLPETGVFSAVGGGLRLVAKGGHNAEPHNHLDVGSFVVAAGGEPLVIDVGSGLYTAASFGEARYEQWFTRSEFHSVPLIGGIQQGVGREFRARDSHADGLAGPPTGWRFSLDLSGAYPRGAAGSWRRTFRPRIDGLLVEDEWSADVAEAQIVLMLARAPERVRSGADGSDRGSTVLGLVGPDSGRVLARLHVEADSSWEEVRLVDPVLRASWGESVVRLVLRPRGGSCRVDIRSIHAER